MNDLYGVDPQAPASADEVIALLRLFGPTEGRFIAAFPAEWIDEVRAWIETQPPVQRTRAQEWLYRRRYAVIDSKRPFRPAVSWAENAQALRDATRALIGPRGCAPTLMPIDKAIYEFGALPDARGAMIPRSAHAYVKAAWPLLAISSKVVLVDPYLRLRSADPRSGAQAERHKVVVKLLLAEAQRLRKVSVFRFCVLTTSALQEDPDGERFAEDLAGLQRQASATTIALEFEVLDEAGEPRQHARYLLGNGCGIQFDHGFDTARDGSTNHVHWLSTAELEPLLEKYDLPGL